MEIKNVNTELFSHFVECSTSPLNPLWNWKAAMSSFSAGEIEGVTDI